MQEDAKNLKVEFPKDFLWGASTSGHQVEGGNRDQWTVWELAHAEELAKMAEKRYSHIPSWPDIKKQAQDPRNYISGKGVEHYQRYKEDFALVKKLNLNAFRFGIEWARLEPEEGKWDETVIEHYRQYISELRKMDIEPVLNAWHWSEQSGSPKRAASKKGKTSSTSSALLTKSAKNTATCCATSSP